MRFSPVILALACCAACGSGPEQHPPPVTAPRAYSVSPGLCAEDCWSLTLYRAADFVELRAHEADGAYLDRAEGMLSAQGTDELDELIASSTELGEVPTDVPHDGPVIGMYVLSVDLEYAEGYSPSGVIELDAFLRQILDDLSQCRTSAIVSSEADCEPLAWFPESHPEARG